jgi:hypothetical protein
VKKLKLKPHHLLDILKLYGKGLSRFVPDKNYGHDFHRIGNLVIENPHVLVRFTLGADEICSPCRYLDRNKCLDVVKDNPVRFKSKEKWNRQVDKRLFELFEVSEGEEMTALAFCRLALEKLTPEKIFEVWKERPQAEIKDRIRLLRRGLKKYLKGPSTPGVA